MRQWVRESYVPMVMTSATEEAQRLCYKNGLSFTELISAFSVLDNVSVPIRTVAHHYNLREFRLRFTPASEVAPPPLDVGEKHLGKCIADNPPEGDLLAHPPIHGSKDVPAAVSQLPKSMPWYQKYRKELWKTLQCQEHDMFDCPAACLLVVSSSNDDPIHCFHELASLHYLPQVFQKGQFEPALNKFFVLLHDNVESAHVNTDAVLRQMKSTFPPANCKILCINSLSEPDLNQKDLWTESVRAPFFSYAAHEGKPKVVKGCMLSPGDMQNLRAFTSELTLKGVLPFLEARMFALNSTVAAVRKGVKNVIKSWWRKPKEEEQRTGDLRYRYDTIESQIRLLGDSAFMLQDYEVALSMYRMVKEDYRADKAYVHFAAANEMVALCLFMIDGNRRELDQALEHAFTSYSRQGEEMRRRNGGHLTICTRLATKVQMLAAEIYQCTSATGQAGGARYFEGAQALLRAAPAEGGLCSALLLEQAANCYLHANPSLYRKYAFHLVLAGHHYHAVSQSRHAVRCYAAAIAVYQGHNWAHIEDHIHFTLARQLFALGNPAQAVHFFLQLIGTGRQSSQQQNTFLREFLYVVRAQRGRLLQQHLDGAKKAAASAGATEEEGQSKPEEAPSSEAVGQIDIGEDTEIEELALPVFNDGALRVFQRTNASDFDVSASEGSEGSGNSVSESVWASLEQNIEHEENIEKTASQNDESWSELLAQAKSRGQQRFGMQYGKGKYTRCGRGGTDEVMVTVAGEPVYVEVEVTNPLAISVELQHFQLFGQLNANDCEGESASNKDKGVCCTVSEESFIELRSAQPISTDPNVNMKVDRRTVILEPGAKRKVVLGVCPLKEGSLAILGVRWCLYGEVWGRHTFKRQGRLLQKTREQKSSRARALDHTLEANVVGVMPWLGVQLKGLPAELLQGEVRQVELEISNHGLAPLPRGSLLLMSTLPMLCVGSQAEHQHAGSSEQLEPVARCVGATGMLLRMDQIELAPGSTVKLPLWVRGRGSGRQCLCLLFRYRESELRTEGSGPAVVVSPKERFVRCSFQLNVEPSLNVMAFARPSYSSNGQHVLIVEVTNLRQQSAIDLLQISAISDQWRIEPTLAAELSPIDVSEDGAEAVLDGSVCKRALRWKEHAVLHFNLIPASPKQCTADVQLVHSDLALEVNDGVDGSGQCSLASVIRIETSVVPWLGLLRMENAVALLREAEERIAQEQKRNASSSAGVQSIQSVRRAATKKKAAGNGQTNSDRVKVPIPTSSAALVQGELELNLLLLWGTSRTLTGASYPKDEAGVENKHQPESVRGQHHCRHVVVRPQPASRQCPLTLTVQYNPHVRHDFKAGVCEVKVCVQLRNGLSPSSHPTSFDFKMLPPAEGRAASGSSVQSFRALRPRFFWVGPTRRWVESLAPGESTTVSLIACFLCPGVFNLNRFQLHVHHADGTKPTIFVFPSPYLITLLAENS